MQFSMPQSINSIVLTVLSVLYLVCCWKVVTAYLSLFTLC